MEKQIGLTPKASPFGDCFWISNPSCLSCSSCLNFFPSRRFICMVPAKMAGGAVAPAKFEKAAF
jgi:hypothetical protein